MVEVFNLIAYHLFISGNSLGVVAGPHLRSKGNFPLTPFSIEKNKEWSDRK